LVNHSSAYSLLNNALLAALSSRSFLSLGALETEVFEGVVFLFKRFLQG
jgi:hypothetical protein